MEEKIRKLEARRKKLLDEAKRMIRQGDLGWELEAIADSIARIDRKIERLHEAN